MRRRLEEFAYDFIEEILFLWNTIPEWVRSAKHTVGDR